LLHGDDIFDVHDVFAQRLELVFDGLLLCGELLGEFVEIAEHLLALRVDGQKRAEVSLMLVQQRHQPGEAGDLRLADLLGHERSRDIDAVQHIADVVQDAGRDLGHAGFARRFEQLLVHFLQAALGPFKFGDVLRNSEGADDLSGAIAQRHFGREHPPCRPVLGGALFDLSDQRLSAADDFLLIRQRVARILLAEEGEIVFADEVFRPDPEIIPQRFAALNETGLEVLEVDEVGGVIHQRAQQIPLVGESDFRLLPVDHFLLQLGRALFDPALKIVPGGRQFEIAGLDLGEHLVEAVDQATHLVVSAFDRTEGVIPPGCHAVGDRRQLQDRGGDDPLQFRSDEQGGEPRSQEDRADDDRIALSSAHAFPPGRAPDR